MLVALRAGAEVRLTVVETDLQGSTA